MKSTFVPEAPAAKHDTPHPVRGVDHCFLLVRDLDSSLEQYRRLGFTVSPRGLHSAKKGTANHTIMLSDNDYFELLGVVADTPENAPRRALLASGGEGLYAVACRIEDAYVAKVGLAARGIATGAVNDFDRPLTLPDGTRATAAFSTLAFEAAEVPVGIAFMCQHRTRDLVWRPELMEHANGARALAGMGAAVDAPEAAARRYARLFAAGRAVVIGDGWRVETGSIPVDFVTRDALGRRYDGLDTTGLASGAFAVLQIAVADRAAAERLLAAAAIPYRTMPHGLAVSPAAASGAIIEFIGP
ncbi:VOC family protein [Nitratireductor sp. StC3]|uniref:VOC family protein n=1 Tax=Nitratireductor sp. StC3 TaxID=2126741 RepID=UPI001FE04EEA|nr:VOC family protein [Nitratireductor sp. StC3]